MITTFELQLSNLNNNINQNMSSLFHGALMELLPSEYAEKMHENTLKPFSQHLFLRDDTVKWVINCLNRECADNVSRALSRDLKSISIKKKDIELDILSRSYTERTYKSFIDTTYFAAPPKRITVFFNMPTSFKEDGRYLIMPNVEMIYKNLIRKFDAFSPECDVYDEDALESLISHSAISSYNLRSTVWHVESIKIPAFAGMINIKIRGGGQLASLANLLLSYGEYSGIGIKTALGMGAVHIRRDGE